MDRSHSACAKRNIVEKNVELDNFVIGAGAHETVSMPDAIGLSDEAGDECIGASITIPLTIHGQSTVVEEEPGDGESGEQRWDGCDRPVLPPIGHISD